MSTVNTYFPTLPEHLSSTPVFEWGSRCSIFSFLCSVLWIVVCGFFLLVIVLSALLWVTDSDYPFVILKLFFQYKQNILTLPVNVINDLFWHRNGMENKTRCNFAFLPVSQVHTITFVIVHFLDNLFSDNRFMWNRSGKRVKITLDLLPESKLFNQTTQPLGKSRQKPNHEVSLLITSSLFLTK
jgi:hypothetical protein